MNVQLTIGSPESTLTFKEIFNSKEKWKESGYRKAFQDEEGRLAAYPWTGLVIPIRVNNLSNFSKDFFLPSTVNLALKCNKLGIKILMVIGCFFLDAITFPIRLLTAIPRAIVAPKKKDNELYKFLIQKEVPEEILKGDYVRVKIEAAPLLKTSLSSTDELRYNYPLIYMPLTVLCSSPVEK